MMNDIRFAGQLRPPVGLTAWQSQVQSGDDVMISWREVPGAMVSGKSGPFVQLGPQNLLTLFFVWHYYCSQTML